MVCKHCCCYISLMFAMYVSSQKPIVLQTILPDSFEKVQNFKKVQKDQNWNWNSAWKNPKNYYFNRWHMFTLQKKFVSLRSIFFKIQIVEERKACESISRSCAAISLSFIAIVTPWALQKVITSCTETMVRQGKNHKGYLWLEKHLKGPSYLYQYFPVSFKSGQSR